MFDESKVRKVARKEVGEVLGWRVTISFRVWDRCVTAPGLDGDIDGGRLYDLLESLRACLGGSAGPGGETISSGSSSDVRVNNYRQSLLDNLLGRFRPGEDDVRLAVFASFGKDGRPLLAVLTEHEASAFRTDHPIG